VSYGSPTRPFDGDRRAPGGALDKRAGSARLDGQELPAFHSDQPAEINKGGTREDVGMELSHAVNDFSAIARRMKEISDESREAEENSGSFSQSHKNERERVARNPS
jgi:hypothetical protein